MNNIVAQPFPLPDLWCAKITYTKGERPRSHVWQASTYCPYIRLVGAVSLVANCHARFHLGLVTYIIYVICRMIFVIHFF
jgi:hypothetical protein